MVTAEYRPRFVLWTSFLAQSPVQLFVSLWAGGFFGGLLGSFFPTGSSALAAHVGSPFLTIGCATFVLFPVVTLAAKKLNYRRTNYRLHDDRIVIVEGFLTEHRKEILFTSVREISLRRGVLQRLSDLGSVYIATTATGQGPRWSPSAILGGGSTFGSGAMLMDLARYEDAYTELRQRVGAQAR
ncbi:PH domain-containing protein [Methylorubrum extorquens]|uniref:PH domain-containing protein n=1 Tax=Methylorubrum extorquens TaxID=408 RepID=UPI003F5E3437